MRWDEAQIVVQSLATGERTVIWEGGSAARYVPTGHLVYALRDGLYAIAFDVDSLTVSGGPVPMVAGVQRAFAPGANIGLDGHRQLWRVGAGVAGLRQRHGRVQRPDAGVGRARRGCCTAGGTARAVSVAASVT